jgi:hypothetical protein
MGRHFTCTFAAALALSAIAAAAATAATRLQPWPPATTKVASGKWNNIAWTLFAGEFVSANAFSSCMKLVLVPSSAPKGGVACSGGGLRKAGELLPASPATPGWPYGMSWGVGHSECPTFYVFAGLILANAHRVAITLSTGKTVTTPTIPSPHGLAQSLRFWVTHIPCGASPTAMIGRDAAGRVVARINSRFLPPIR